MARRSPDMSEEPPKLFPCAETVRRSSRDPSQASRIESWLQSSDGSREIWHSSGIPSPSQSLLVLSTMSQLSADPFPLQSRPGSHWAKTTELEPRITPNSNTRKARGSVFMVLYLQKSRVPHGRGIEWTERGNSSFRYQGFNMYAGAK